MRFRDTYKLTNRTIGECTEFTTAWMDNGNWSKETQKASKQMTKLTKILGWSEDNVNCEMVNREWEEK